MEKKTQKNRSRGDRKQPQQKRTKTKKALEVTGKKLDLGVTENNNNKKEQKKALEVTEKKPKKRKQERKFNSHGGIC